MSGFGAIPRLFVLMISAKLGGRVAVCACLGLEGAGIALAIMGPFALKLLMDRLGTHHAPVTEIGYYVALFVIAWTATTVLAPTRNIFSAVINTRLTKELSLGALAGTLRDNCWRSTDSAHVQGLLERLPYSLAIVVDGLIWRTVPLAVQLIISLAVIVHVMSWTYAAGFAAFAIGFIAISWFGISRQVKLSRAYNERLAASGELVGDILKNAHRVVANGTVAHELASVGASFDDRGRSEALMNTSLVRLGSLQWLVTAAALFAIMLLAGLDVSRGQITAGDFVLVQGYAIQLIIPMSAVAFVLSQSASALATVSDVLDMQGNTEIATTETSHNRRAACIRVEAVSFSYGPSLGGVSDITLEFPAGSFSVIVGANGSGKSTLAQLIAGLLTPDSGQIRIGCAGADGTVEQRESARQILYVPQRTSLFNRTLRANLLYPPCRHDEATALQILRSWDFQETSRPIDPELKVGEGGRALSGGQAQKLELARIIGVETPCLVLDESTSALDPKSEALVIGELIRTIGQRTTVIFITHRDTVAQMADQVIWMSAGRGIAVGAHHELLGFKAYRDLWGAEEKLEDTR